MVGWKWRSCVEEGVDGLGESVQRMPGAAQGGSAGSQVDEMDERCSLLAGLAASELINVLV